MSVTDRPGRAAPRTLALSLALLAAGAGAAAAASPFGVGLAEPAATGGGLFPGLFRTIAAWQSSFYRELTGLVSAMKEDGTAGLWLCAFSFLYGVLHAAGPGHGKAIVSGYVLANRETARNGAVLAMVSAMAQAVTAVVLVLVAAVALGATAMSMTRATVWFEAASFALIFGLGVWLTWRKVVRPLAAARARRFAPVRLPAGFAFAAAGGGPALATHGRSAHRHAHDHPHGHDHHHHGHDHHHHGHDHHGHDHRHGHGHAGGAHAHHHDDHVHGPDCGCAHGPTAAEAAGRLDWRKAWATVVAVGLRPCTGALIVLVFALGQGLLLAGVAATFAMALGTGMTVAALTLAAVSMRGLAGRITGGGAVGEAVHAGIEGAGALAVLAFGALMLGATFAG